MVRSSVKWQSNILLSSLRSGKWFLLFFICQVVKHSATSTVLLFLFFFWDERGYLRTKTKMNLGIFVGLSLFFSMKWALHDIMVYLKFRVRCGICWFDKMWYKFVTSLSGGTRVCIVLFSPLPWLCWHFLSVAVLIFSWNEYLYLKYMYNCISIKKEIHADVCTTKTLIHSVLATGLGIK